MPNLHRIISCATLRLLEARLELRYPLNTIQNLQPHR